MISIEQVAEKAGVSPSTVSLALRNRPRVSDKTRKAILKAADDLGYEKNSPGRPRKKPGDPLTPKSTNRIALVVPDITLSVLHAPVYASLLHGIEEALSRKGKTFVLRHIRPDQTKLRPNQVLPLRVDGALLLRGTQNSTLLSALRHVPVVQLMRDSIPGESWDRVTYNNRKLGQIAAEHLLSEGHKNTAFIGHICGSDDAFLQQRGLDFKKVMTAHGGKADLIVRDFLQVTRQIHAIRPEDMQEALATALSLKPKITAVFVEADMVAQALYSAMQRIGLVPGKDLQVISCNHEAPILTTLYPIPTTIDIHAEQIGKKGVECMLWRIENPKAKKRLVELDPTLVLGDSSSTDDAV